MNRTIEEWREIGNAAGGTLLAGAISDLQELARQIETEQSRREVCEVRCIMLLDALEGVTLSREDIEMGRSAVEGQHAAARVAIDSAKRGMK